MGHLSFLFTNVHSVSSLSVPISATVVSSPLSVPSLPWVETYHLESNTVSFAQERRLMVPLMYFHSECVFVKG